MEEYERFLKINLEIFENLKELKRKMCESRNKCENFESCDKNREIGGHGESYENNAGVT